MFRFNIILLGLFLAVVSCQPSYSQLRAKGFLISDDGTTDGERWATYLFTHLQKRSDDKKVILRRRQEEHPPQGYFHLHILVNPELPFDYEIKNGKSVLYLSAKDNRTMLWLIYQLIDRIGQANDYVRHEDLPPAYIDFTDQARNCDFSYREPHYQPNTDSDYAGLLATNQLDVDWGIWGHNLSKVVDGTEAIHAKVAGRTNPTQLCFSSPELLELTKAYILDNFGDGEKGHGNHFMLAPEDNAIACTCEACTAAGNKVGDASAAVFAFLEKLSLDYPNHHFFTTIYGTVKTPPKERLPNNVGVLLSTIDLPKGVAWKDSEPFLGFKRKVGHWALKTPKLYLWDYSMNFDDYLTIQPSLLGMQAQWKSFKAMGIKGIFLNASGYDYSSLDDLKTYVAAALMHNVDISVEQLMQTYLQRFYPKSAEILANYLIAQEKLSFQGKGYGMYAGFKEIQHSYLLEDKFLSFYNDLEKRLPQVSGEERIRLQKLFLAMGLTKLQLAYQKGLDPDGAFEIIDHQVQVKKKILALVEDLSPAFEGKRIQIYKEAEGNCSDYFGAWKSYVSLQQQPNLLSVSQVKWIQPAANSREALHTCLNGILGFPKDYQQGWFTSNENIAFEVNFNNLKGTKGMLIRFLINEKHRFNLPSTFEIHQSGKLIHTLKFSSVREEEFPVREISIPLKDIDLSKPIMVRLQKSEEGNKRLAIDELQILD